MQAYVITIFGLPMSEAGAQKCIDSGAAFGLVIEPFPAVSRYEAMPAMQQAGLKLNRKTYRGISDEPIGDREQVPRGDWLLTTPELGCFMSHYYLWQRCVERNEPILILEHDARIVTDIPDLPSGTEAMNLYRRPFPTTAGYLISPKGAARVIKEAKRRGVQPSDEVLWRAALRSRPTAVVRESAVLVDDGGVSTIQFTRQDETHENILKTDPWSDFSDT